MKTKYIIEPSLLAFDLTQLEKQLAFFKKQGFKHIHYDVMDGKFVPNKTCYSEHINFIRQKGFRVTVHLMVKNPLKHVRHFAKFDVDAITWHPTVCNNLINNYLLNYLKKQGIRGGFALNPYDNFDKYTKLIKKSDIYTCMTVVAGKGGQPFLEDSLTNFNKVCKIKEQHPNLWIQMDGGVNDKIVKRFKNQVNRFVIGTYLFKIKNPGKVLKL